MTGETSDDRTAEQTLDRLVLDHRPALMAYSLRLTAGDHAWAEDVVQEVFIRAWRRLDRMTEQHGSVRSWLLRVTHNLVVDGYRARRDRPFEPTLSQHLEPGADASVHVLHVMELDEALSRLAGTHRVVLEQVYLHDRSMAEAADLLGLPLGTVKSRAFYALRQLRAHLAPPDPAQGRVPRGRRG